ncbi:MAG: cache domain-containing protein [Kiritimatiellae bacterium]|nr:cache domain-containing protein [Kiritimatiellia bacterium]MDD5519746.1 cache domain-containing protein [Kiritimatiellia bacterium]
MSKAGTEKQRGPRRSVFTMLVIGVFVFFAIYYVVLKNFNMEAKKEIASRVRNVSSCLDAVRDTMANNAWWVASRPDLVSAMEKNDTNSLQRIGKEVAARTRAATVTILSTNGTAATWGHAPEAEENLRKFYAVQLALAGKPAAGLEEDPSLNMVIRAACPVKSNNDTIGVVIIGMNIFSDHSFVDGVIKNFGLVCSVFHNDIRISTTIYKEGKRALGTKLNNSKIHSEVVVNGGIYQGRNKAVDKEYDTAYWPLRNTGGKIIGVVGIGKDRETIARIFSVAAVIVLIVAGFAGFITARESFRLQSLILLIIVPALVIITGIAGWLLYRNLHAIIIEGFNGKLFALSTTTASCLDGDRLRNVLDKQDSNNPDYLAYMKTLREIQKQKDVTYLYTFLLGGKKDIVYIIDASPGNDFCPIGYEENLPMQNMDGLRRVVSDGIPYISEIQEYERYGLLKVSAAPVYGKTNSVQALTGVDINISVIKKKLNTAISHILGVGAFALLLAGLTAMWFSTKLIKPLTRVKSGALRLAAGNYGRQIDVSGPIEIEALASAFNRVGNTIGGILQKAVANNEKAEVDRRHVELAKELAEISTYSNDNAAHRLILRWTGGRADCANASGAITQRNLLLAWIAAHQDDSLKAIKIRRDVAVIGSRLIQKHGNEKTFIISTFRNMFKNTVNALMLFDADTGMIHPIIRQPTPALLLDSAGNLKEIILSDDKEIPVKAGTTVILTSQIPTGPLADLIKNKRIPHVAGDLSSRATAMESGIRSRITDIGQLSNGLLILLERRTSK